MADTKPAERKKPKGVLYINIVALFINTQSVDFYQASFKETSRRQAQEQLPCISAEKTIMEKQMSSYM